MRRETLERAFQFVRYLDPNLVREIHLTGGEPSMYPELDIVGSLAGQVSVPLTIATSGWVPKTGSWKDFINRHSISKVYVSLDSFDEITNDICRGQKSYHLALNTIMQAIAVRKIKGTPSVTVVSVITRNNLPTLGALIQSLLDLGVDRWFPSYLENAHQLPHLRLRASDLRLLKSMRRNDSILDRVLGPSFDSDFIPNSILVKGYIPTGMLSSTCKTAGNLLTIHPNGKIYGCYGAEYTETSLIGDIIIDEHPIIMQSLKKFSHSRTTVCHVCPEPYQRSIDLRQFANDL